MREFKAVLLRSVAVVALVFASAAGMAQANAAEKKAVDGPETVLATFRVKSDQVAALLKMMPEYWQTMRRLDLVTAEPYALMQGMGEDGKPIVVQLFQWKNHEVSDHVPAEVQAYWDKFQTMVESRGGCAGIEFPEVSIVEGKGSLHGTATTTTPGPTK